MFEWLAQSIWGYPIVAALHVAGLAWFGATVLTPKDQFRIWKRVGLVSMVVTGLLIFGMHVDRYVASTSFRIKIILLAAVLIFKLPRPVMLALWLAIIFVSRGIAFF